MINNPFTPKTGGVFTITDIYDGDTFDYDFQAMPPQGNLSIVRIILEIDQAQTSEQNLAKLFRIMSLENWKKTVSLLCPPKM